MDDFAVALRQRLIKPWTSPQKCGTSGFMGSFGSWKARGRYMGTCAAPATLLCALLFASALAAAEPAASPNPMIPPGQEDLLAEMLGRGVTLAGCNLTGAGVEYTIVEATYACPEGEAVFDLAHPSTASPSAIQTAQFAITLQSGSPPHSLADALVSSIRAREDAFEWEWLPSKEAKPADDTAADDD